MRKTIRNVAAELNKADIQVSPTTVGRILKELGFSLRVNAKKISTVSSVDRDKQFSYITDMRERYCFNGDPIISIDTKKKELVGNFKNQGKSWNQEPIEVNDHDFRSDAIGKAIPYGIYDVCANRGSIFVGVSHDTPHFSVENLEKWWRYNGRHRYPGSRELLILADCGGSNRPTSRVWKYGLQDKLVQRYGINVTVSHYPPGASKWNPIEHRLFCEISKNWAGQPLTSYETILNYIRTTKTSTGLKVKGYLVSKDYPLGVKISDEMLSRVCIRTHNVLPCWNYTIGPSKM
jgi:hypothetical protein